MSGIADLYASLRAETARMLGYDLAALTPPQDVKLGMVAGLRLELDRLTTAQMRGEEIDPRVLVSISELLETALRPPVEARELGGDDTALAKVRALIEGQRLSAQRTIEDLRAEVERLKGELETARFPAAVSPAPAVPIERTTEAPQPAPAPAAAIAKPARATKPAAPAEVRTAESETERLSSREPPRTPASSEGFSKYGEPWRGFVSAGGISAGRGWRRFDPPAGW
jgi:hypothetical protein